MNSKWIKNIIILIFLAFAAIIFYKKVYLPKTTYKSITPIYGDMHIERFGIGDIGAKDIYPVTAQTGGKIIKLTKDEGDWVKKGETVAQIDPVDMYDLLAQAKASKAKILHQAESAKKALDSIYAKLDLAEITFKRYNALYKKGFAAQAEYDRAEADLKSLEAQAEAQKALIEAAEAEEKSAQESINALKKKILRLRVLSPVSGYVITRNAVVGQSVAPTQPLITVVDPKWVWVRANFDESISKEIQVGQSAEITLRSRPETPVEGRVARIEAKSDPVTEERIVDVAFKKLPKPFYISEQAEARILIKTLHNVVKIPPEVLVHLNGKRGVWLYEKGEARFKPLKILAVGEKMIAVDGIGKNVKILVPDPKKRALADGKKVRL